MKKPYLVFMAGPNSVDDLREMIEPIKPYIRGICAILHDSDEFSMEAGYLLRVNTQLGAGDIIFGQYGRHDHSRNRILYETGIKEGDWYCQTDVLEHPKPDFFRYFDEYLVKDNPDIDAYYYYGKPFFVKFNENLRYQGNPHESLIGLNRPVEMSIYHPEDKQVRENMRPIKRANQPFHWVNHYARYYLLPSSNQCLLGLDNNPNRVSIFNERQQNRKEFLNYLESVGINRNLSDIIGYWKLYGINKDAQNLIGKEKILSDLYRLNILDDKSVKDNHDLNDTYKFL